MSENIPEYAPAWPGTRSWTPAEALGAMPLVRRIVDDLVDGYRRWHEAVGAFELAAANSKADAPDAEAERLMAAAQALAAEIDGYRNELARLDIRVTRVERGVIAFRSELEFRIVPLYWMPGADAPTYDCPDSLAANGTSISWPSRAQDVEGKRSRA